MTLACRPPCTRRRFFGHPFQQYPFLSHLSWLRFACSSFWLAKGRSDLRCAPCLGRPHPCCLLLAACYLLLATCCLLLAACYLLACGPAYWRVFTSKVQARQALGGGGRRWQGLHLRFFQFLASLLPALIGPYRPLPAPPVPAHDHPALPPPPCPDGVDVMPTPSACAAALDRGGAAQRLVGGSSAGGRAGQQRHGGGTNACSCRCHVPACAQRRCRTRLRS